MKQLEADGGLRVLQPAIELQPQGLCLGQFLHLGNVGNGGNRIERIAIARAEAQMIKRMQTVALMFTDFFNQPVAQHVAPASHRVNYLLFNRGNIGV